MNEVKSFANTSINWYPGHMTKALRQMKEDIKLIDVVIELIDARIPYSSKNPDIDKLAVNKKRVILLNKSDMADDKLTAQWKAHYESAGYAVAVINSKNGNGIKAINDLVINPLSIIILPVPEYSQPESVLGVHNLYLIYSQKKMD